MRAVKGEWVSSSSATSSSRSASRPIIRRSAGQGPTVKFGDDETKRGPRRSGRATSDKLKRALLVILSGTRALAAAALVRGASVPVRRTPPLPGRRYCPIAMRRARWMQFWTSGHAPASLDVVTAHEGKLRGKTRRPWAPVGRQLSLHGLRRGPGARKLIVVQARTPRGFDSPSTTALHRSERGGNGPLERSRPMPSFAVNGQGQVRGHHAVGLGSTVGGHRWLSATTRGRSLGRAHPGFVPGGPALDSRTSRPGILVAPPRPNSGAFPVLPRRPPGRFRSSSPFRFPTGGHRRRPSRPPPLGYLHLLATDISSLPSLVSMPLAAPWDFVPFGLTVPENGWSPRRNSACRDGNAPRRGPQRPAKGS